jgi:biopolymer transport protein ExbB
MNGLRELVATGGPVVFVIMTLSVLLYERCFALLVFLHRSQRGFAAIAVPGAVTLAEVQRRQDDLRDAFRQHRLTISAMITAAPLLGLLGTVMGMIGAFDSLAAHGSQRSMEGLARGISEVLVATASGLAVAIPAVLLLYLGHRQMEKGIQKFTALEAQLRELA